MTSLNNLNVPFLPLRHRTIIAGSSPISQRERTKQILEYISRVKDLRFAILEEDREYYRDFARNHPQDLERLTLDSFIDDLRMRLQQHHFETLDEVFDLAVLVDKKMDSDLPTL